MAAMMHSCGQGHKSDRSDRKVKEALLGLDQQYRGLAVQVANGPYSKASAPVDRFHETNRTEWGSAAPTDLILRSRAQHAVSKDEG